MGSLTLYDLLGVTGDVASRVSAGVEMVLGRRGAVGGLLTDHALQQLLENWVRKKRCKHEQKEHWLHRETHSRLVQPPPCPCDCGSHGPLCTIATIGPSTHVHVGSHYYRYPWSLQRGTPAFQSRDKLRKNTNVCEIRGSIVRACSEWLHSKSERRKTNQA